MVNFLAIEKMLDEQKFQFVEWLKKYVDETLKPQIRDDVARDLKVESEQPLKKFENIQLSKANAEFFLKCIKAIETIESLRNPTSKVAKIAQEIGLSEEDVEVLVKAVRYHRIYEKIKGCVGEIHKFI